MRRNFREPQFILRVIVGVLLAANLIAAGILLFPPGGSAEDLEKQLASLQAQAIFEEGFARQDAAECGGRRSPRPGGGRPISGAVLPGAEGGVRGFAGGAGKRGGRVEDQRKRVERYV